MSFVNTVFLVVLTVKIVTVISYPEISLPDCLSITSYGEYTCNQETYKWCKWNNDYSICQTTNKVKLDAIFIDWFDFGINGFWIICIPVIYLIIFLIAKIICFILLKYNIISLSYSEKCLIYLFEILSAAPILYKVFYPINIYNPVVYPDKYRNLTPSTFHKLYGSITFCGASLCCIYIIEMVYARHMRWQLKVHHWVTIFSMMATIVALNQRTSLDLYRAGIPLTLYAITESHVFIQLLLYRIFPSKFVIFHYLSAYLYVISRLCAFSAMSVCYIQWCFNYGKFIITNNILDVGYAYVFFFYYIGFANLILNFVQYSSIKALFFIAEKVYKRSKLRKQFEYHPRIQELYDIYTNYDDDIIHHSGSNTQWSFEELNKFLYDYCDFYPNNEMITELIFKSFLTIQNKLNFIKKKSEKQKRKIKGIKWKTFLFLFESELIYISNKFDTKHIITQKVNLFICGSLAAIQSVDLRINRSSTGSSELSDRIQESEQVRNLKMKQAVKILSDSIENLNENAIDNIINISHSHNKSQMMKNIINNNNNNNNINNNKCCKCLFHCQFCILFCLRCVPCRYGCKTKYMIAELEHDNICSPQPDAVMTEIVGAGNSTTPKLNHTRSASVRLSYALGDGTGIDPIDLGINVFELNPSESLNAGGGYNNGTIRDRDFNSDPQLGQESMSSNMRQKYFSRLNSRYYSDDTGRDTNRDTMRDTMRDTRRSENPGLTDLSNMDDRCIQRVESVQSMNDMQGMQVMQGGAMRTVGKAAVTPTIRRVESLPGEVPELGNVPSLSIYSKPSAREVNIKEVIGNNGIDGISGHGMNGGMNGMNEMKGVVEDNNIGNRAFVGHVNASINTRDHGRQVEGLRVVRNGKSGKPIKPIKTNKPGKSRTVKSNKSDKSKKIVVDV